uniref:Uncharacterized protein n=1 Tax=Amphimedon queenslandica TaxID=400682 RepID=A0A1X7SDJ2_AMPQE
MSLQPMTNETRLRSHSHRQMSLQADTQPLLTASPEEDPREGPNEDIADIIEKEAFRTVGFDKGIVCYCAGVECVFEMILYEYIKKQEREQIVSQISL